MYHKRQRDVTHEICLEQERSERAMWICSGRRMLVCSKLLQVVTSTYGSVWFEFSLFHVSKTTLSDLHGLLERLARAIACANTYAIATCIHGHQDDCGMCTHVSMDIRMTAKGRNTHTNTHNTCICGHQGDCTYIHTTHACMDFGMTV